MRASVCVCVCVWVNVFAYLQPIAHFDGRCLATGRVCVSVWRGKGAWPEEKKLSQAQTKN